MDLSIQKKINSKILEITEQDLNTREIKVKAELQPNETRVYKQALRHNIWLKVLDVIKDKFPNESSVIQDYRNANKRQFTKEITRKIHQGIVSVLTQIQIEVVSLNEKFNTWFNSKPFWYNNSKFDFIPWSINVAIPYSLIDPNAIFIPFPVFKGLNTVIEVIPQIIPYNKKWIDPAGEYMVIINDVGFYVVDKFEWWQVVKKGNNYEWTLIYTHNLGELPYENLPSLSSFDVSTNRSYGESIISSTYELLDEAAVSHTSYQAIKLKMQNILVRPGISCKTCNGEGTILESGDTRRIDCGGCGGTGLAKRVTDHEDLTIKASDLFGSDGKILQPYYLSPDTSCAEFLKQDHEDLMLLSKKSVGIDALIDKSESGEAMKKRLGTFEEFISYLLYITYTTHLTKFLELVFKMLENDQSKWVDFPQIKVPKRVEIKTPEILKETFDSAKGVDRLQAGIEYYKSKYAQSPNDLRAMMILINYYPAAIEANADLQSLILMGVYSRIEVSKAKKALPIIHKIIDNLGVLEKTDEKIFEEVEKILSLNVPEDFS